MRHRSTTAGDRPTVRGASSTGSNRAAVLHRGTMTHRRVCLWITACRARLAGLAFGLAEIPRRPAHPDLGSAVPASTIDTGFRCRHRPLTWADVSTPGCAAGLRVRWRHPRLGRAPFTACGQTCGASRVTSRGADGRTGHRVDAADRASQRAGTNPETHQRDGPEPDLDQAWRRVVDDLPAQPAGLAGRQRPGHPAREHRDHRGRRRVHPQPARGPAAHPLEDAPDRASSAARSASRVTVDPSWSPTGPTPAAPRAPTTRRLDCDVRWARHRRRPMPARHRATRASWATARPARSARSTAPASASDRRVPPAARWRPGSTRSTPSRPSSSAPPTGSRTPPRSPSPRRRARPTTRCWSTATPGWARPTCCTPSGTTSAACTPAPGCATCSSEEFTNEFINAIRDDRQDRFKRRYRDVDVLLIDDIQFLEGKIQTQEEFFHTFNTLHNANKQIVITSDRAPKRLEALEDRLRNRFEWGLITDVQPPDLETRIAILRKKAATERLTAPPDVLEFIASQDPDQHPRARGRADPGHRVRQPQPAAGRPDAGRDRAQGPDPRGRRARDHRGADHRPDRRLLRAVDRRPVRAQPQPGAGHRPADRDVPVPRAHRPVAAQDRRSSSAAATTPR